MDLEQKRQLIQRGLTDYAKATYAYGELELQTVFDTVRDHYLLVLVGWHNRRVHGCLVHIDLIDGKLWIQRDGSEYGMACYLNDEGIPKDQIVLAFKSPDVRPYTGYAVA